ncbi:MAG: GNAT family N-acetyltransferase [Anaerovoracaceae bacterium]
MDFRIVAGETYETLGEFFLNNGLEVSQLKTIKEGLIETYSIRDTNNMLIGAVSIVLIKGKYTVFDIAVDNDFRNKGYGEKLLDLAVKRIFEETDRVYLVAKAPKFFEKNGFFYVPKKDIPPIFHCLTCEQYNLKCFPKVMCKTIR